MSIYAESILDDVTTVARTYLRDFPRFFQVSFDAVGRTYELGHINIDTDTVWIATNVGASVSELTPAQYSLDIRNGILRLATTPPSGAKIMVEGYFYEWVSPADLDFYAKQAINQHIFSLEIPLENMAQVIIETIGMRTICEVLMALMSEYSRDIDVNTSESVHIPASQRFRMAQSLLSYWAAEYEKQARALNIGVDRIEIFNLRRVSRTTNRYVPLYRNKELGDYGPVERLFPNPDKQVIDLEEAPIDKLREDVLVDMDPPRSYVHGTYI
jgi:plasmid stabilization system protein ParE